MNILFLTLDDFSSLEERNINTDLLREFIEHGDVVYVISPTEKRKKSPTRIIKGKHSTILKLKIGNIQKTSVIEKGISTLQIEWLLIKGIKKFFPQVRFDLVLYNTPPITFCKVIKFIKERDNAHSYLLLKDIFPQNALDINLLKKTGIKGILYYYFRNKEKHLYSISDYIGCMSDANVKYLLDHNPEINPNIVEVCPNSVEPIDRSITEIQREKIREKYAIPLSKKVFVYGGNLGKPQGIDHLLKCIHSQRNNVNAYFLIVGDGTEYKKIEYYVNKFQPRNMQLLKRLSRDDYDQMIGACDVGLLFLDHRFTIPNFPSRVLSYMQAKLPVLAVTDTCTDIGKVVVDGGFGWWCESDDIDKFSKQVENIFMDKFLLKKGENGFEYLSEYYTAYRSYMIIKNHFVNNIC